MKYWINTISKDHVLKGVETGFTQADHGKNTRLTLLNKNDFIIFYSPKTELKGGDKLQTFTALGQIMDSIPYQVKMTPSFHPWRRNVRFFNCQEIPIKEILDSLSFIKNKQYWGIYFRRGLFNVPRVDFDFIAKAMKVELI